MNKFIVQGGTIIDDPTSNFRVEFSDINEARKYLTDSGFEYVGLNGACMERFRKPIVVEVRGNIKTEYLVGMLSRYDLLPPYFRCASCQN